MEKISQFNNQRTKKKRCKEIIVDSTNIENYKTCNLIKYSGKYHNYCSKLTVWVTKDLVPIHISIDYGSKSDSRILDDNLGKFKLPYKLYADKGFEKYERRRALRKKNCRMVMEMKKGKNKKRGPKFKCTAEEKATRGLIEKFFGWIKSFNSMVRGKARKRSTIIGSILFVICYVVFGRLFNLGKL